LEVLDVARSALEWAQAWLPSPAYDYLVTMARVFSITAVFLALERFGPVEEGQPRNRLTFNLRWILVYGAMTSLIMDLGFDRILPPVRDALGGPWIRLGRPDTLFGYLANWLVFLLAFDFLYYWLHRWQHRSSLLWRQHLLHHTERSLNVSTTQRHHWLEAPLRLFVIGIPLATMIAVNRSGAPLLGFALGAWGFFIHANMRLSLGPLSGWLAGPQVHRIHHSIEPAHQDRNFAAYFPLWDRLFGTYWAPASGEYPEVGVADVPCVARVRDAFWFPFRRARPEISGTRRGS
jgi:sterol desaturase/sphingolipid hydroxylase (fatty acid hydroxylase superfamily)